MVNNEKKVVNNENQEILTKTVVGLGIPGKEWKNPHGAWMVFTWRLAWKNAWPAWPGKNGTCRFFSRGGNIGLFKMVVGLGMAGWLMEWWLGTSVSLLFSKGT